jgi:hypothetical protein
MWHDEYHFAMWQIVAMAPRIFLGWDTCLVKINA